MKKRIALLIAAVLIPLWLLGGFLHHGRVVCFDEVSDFGNKTNFTKDEYELAQNHPSLVLQHTCRFEFRKR